MINDYISTNYKKIREMCFKIKHTEINDIFQEVILNVLEMDEKRLNELTPILDFYIFKMCWYSATSKTSKYQNKYKKVEYDYNFNIDSLECEEYEEVIKMEIPELKKYFRRLNMFQEVLMTKIVDDKINLHQLHLKTNIQYYTLRDNYLKSIKKIKKMINE